MKKQLNALALVAISLAVSPLAAFAEEGATHAAGGDLIAIASAIAIGLAALGGTLAQGKAVASGLDSIGRNPGASGKLLIPMILGLALIESLVILAFVIANNLAGKL